MPISLLEGLNKIEFSEAMKEMQTNWIGKSSGAEIDFEIDGTGKNYAYILPALIQYLALILW